MEIPFISLPQASASARMCSACSTTAAIGLPLGTIAAARSTSTAARAGRTWAASVAPTVYLSVLLRIYNKHLDLVRRRSHDKIGCDTTVFSVALLDGEQQKFVLRVNGL